jgi:hypothetical protein
MPKIKLDSNSNPNPKGEGGTRACDIKISHALQKCFPEQISVYHNPCAYACAGYLKLSCFLCMFTCTGSQMHVHCNARSPLCKLA